MRPLSRLSRVSVPALALAGALLLGACSGGGDDEGAPLEGGGPIGGGNKATTSAAPPVELPASTIDFKPPGKTFLPQETALLTAYKSFWQAIASGFGSGNYASIQQVTAQPATGQFVNRTRALAAAGQRQQGPISLTPAVRNQNNETATVVDCADLRQFRTYDREGKPLKAADTAYTIVQVDLVNRGGRWLVNRYIERLNGCKR